MRTPASAIKAAIEQDVAAKRLALIRRMAYIGENAVNQMRDAGSYQDHTNNLRSSTGYVIVADGQVVSEAAFETAGNGTEGNGEYGSQSGRRFAEEMARQYPTGIVLVVVAGMSYASYVNDKGYDVIDSGEIIAKRLVKQLMKKGL